MPSGDHPTRRWERPEQFNKEVRKLKLSRDEAAVMVRVMDRHAKGQTFRRDHKVLREGVEELRIDGNHRTFRVYFTRVEGGLVLLCLHAHAKKKDNDREAVDRAVERRKAHLDGRWP